MTKPTIIDWDMAKEPSYTAYMIVLNGEFRSVSKAVFDRYERMRARTLHRRSGKTGMVAIATAPTPEIQELMEAIFQPEQDETLT